MTPTAQGAERRDDMKSRSGNWFAAQKAPRQSNSKADSAKGTRAGPQGFRTRALPDVPSSEDSSRPERGPARPPDQKYEILW
jgi:hypothetical protein